jgi:hypothetical protein
MRVAPRAEKRADLLDSLAHSLAGKRVEPKAVLLVGSKAA